MKIERKTYRDGNLYPEVFNCLKQLPDDVLFHSAYTERHPFSIYSLSMQRIIKAFEAVLDEMDKIHAALFNSDEQLSYRLDKVPDLQKELLSAMQSHLDDCYRILRTVHPPSEINEKFVDRWLEKVKHPTYKDFKSNTDDYRNSFSIIVNKIKHNGGIIRPVMMYERGRGIVAEDHKSNIRIFPKNARIIGYFLEGMQPDGCIGPDHDIHPGGKTAISLNRDLRFHFANLYRIGRHLKRALLRSVRIIHNLELSISKTTRDFPDKQRLEKVAENISHIPSLFFRDEFSKATPDIRYYQNTQGSELILEFPGARQSTWHGEVFLYGEFQVDSDSLRYRIPYMDVE